MSINILLLAHNIPNTFPSYWYLVRGNKKHHLLISLHMQQKVLVVQEYAAMSHEKNPKTTG